jgi:hypothetical protein
MAELSATAVIENRLDFLRDHPDHLNWMLSPFVCNREVARLVDARYVTECVKYIREVRPLVRPVNEADMNKLPSIVIASYQGEAQQFLGDYGMDMQVQNFPPQVVTSFDVTWTEAEVIKTTKEVAGLVWPGLFARQGDFSSRIKMVVEGNNETSLHLESAPPAGITLRAWNATTSVKTKAYELNSSMDTVKINVTLTTAGDHAIHRLMAVLLRYCLKSGRRLFDSYGLQVASFGQQPVVLADPDQIVWQTMFTIEAKMTDHWIANEYEIDDSGPLEIVVVPDREI